MRFSFRSVAASALAATLALSVLTPSAHAQDLSSGVEDAVTTPAGNLLHTYDPFYDDPVVPEQLGAPGTLLRTQPAPPTCSTS
ncbi:hypothetical protein [Corynebacterium liangguodongii]|uniref:hypothetical protein n=1 Tax=Corynebacterium liangguodongii TaxID=2079535 RepID=UPI001F428D0F|nr:hypothetical protein [Corynebacterium liangguodongii]